MLCTNCKQERATVFYTQIIDGAESSAALCKRCAKRAGIDSADMLTPLFHPLHTTQKACESPKKCNLCGLTFLDIQRLGKVGCPDCYKTFREELREIIRSIHGSAKHVSSFPKTEDSEEEVLRERLSAAIEAENYEEAAVLRDAIRALKGDAK